MKIFQLPVILEGRFRTPGLRLSASAGQEYKRRFAWIKAGKLTEEQFAAWHKAAKARKKDCDKEIISLDKFKT